MHRGQPHPGSAAGGPMELRMQYVTTRDGVRIAFATAGSGAPPLVRASNVPFCHAQLEWRAGTFFDRLAQNRLVVPFDPRGTGLSDRDPEDLSLEARKLDLEAVVDRLGLQRFALHAVGSSGPVAVTYAVRNPDRVSHLVLDDSYACARDYLGTPQSRALGELTGEWEDFTESIAFMEYGSSREQARSQAAFFRACVSPATARRLWQATRQDDVSELLPEVRVPTLVLQHTMTSSSRANLGRELAALIPDARYVVVEGTALETDEIVRALDEFLVPEAPQEAPGRDAAARAGQALRTILFTDLEGSAALTERLGDQAARELLREHERLTRQALASCGGSEIKALGDGFMASFATASQALECAIAIQRMVAEQNQRHPETPIRVRAGLNAGEPIAEDDDLFGTAVILCARVAAQAGGGEILASNVVRELVAGKGFLFVDRGDIVLRGFEDPVRVYELRWEDRG